MFLFMVFSSADNPFPRSDVCFYVGILRSQTESRSKAYRLYGCQGGGLLVPYILWSLLYLGATCTFFVLQHEAIIWSDYAVRILTGGASAQLYYVLVLFQLVILTPLFLHLLGKKVWRIILYSITPVHLTIIYIFNIQVSPDIGPYGELFSAWLFFYLLGLDARAGRLETLIEHVKLWHVIIALVVAIAEAFLLLHLTFGEPVFNQIRFCNFFFVTVFDLWLLKNSRSLDRDSLAGLWWYRLGVKLGDASYGIYFCHMAVLLIMEKILQMFNLSAIWAVYWIFSWGAMSFCLIWTGLACLFPVAKTSYEMGDKGFGVKVNK